MEKLIENYWKTYQTINEWIRFSDTKAGVIVTIYGILLTIIYSNANDIYSILNISAISAILSIITGILSALSLYFAFKCLNPRLKNKNPKSILYFGHISTYKDYKAYSEYSKNIFNDENSLIEQLAEQIYVNSTISWKKYKNVSIAIRFFFASVVFLLSIIIIYFFCK